jgi:hypothetical protein
VFKLEEEHSEKRFIVAPEFGPPMDKKPFPGITVPAGNRNVPFIPVKKFVLKPIK